MKYIVYTLKSESGTLGAEKSIPYSSENEEVAKAEAYNGEYAIVDDGQPETVVEPSAQEDTDAMLIDHEFRLTMLELGLTE
jgi:hypothetical protein